jgi:hypothetical protein
VAASLWDLGRDLWDGGILILMAFSKNQIELWASVIVTAALAVGFAVRRKARPPTARAVAG